MKKPNSYSLQPYNRGQDLTMEERQSDLARSFVDPFEVHSSSDPRLVGDRVNVDASISLSFHY